MQNTKNKKQSSLQKLENLEPITFKDLTDDWEIDYVYSETKKAYETKDKGWFIVPIEYLFDVANGKYPELEIY